MHARDHKLFIKKYKPMKDKMKCMHMHACFGKYSFLFPKEMTKIELLNIKNQYDPIPRSFLSNSLVLEVEIYR